MDVNANGTNSSGFNAFPAGRRNEEGIFSAMGKGASWWSTMQNDENTVWICGILSLLNSSKVYFLKKGGGIAVRCIKDAEK